VVNEANFDIHYEDALARINQINALNNNINNLYPENNSEHYNLHINYKDLHKNQEN
jgi:hypothetical protein